MQSSVILSGKAFPSLPHTVLVSLEVLLWKQCNLVPLQKSGTWVLHHLPQWVFPILIHKGVGVRKSSNITSWEFCLLHHLPFCLKSLPKFTNCPKINALLKKRSHWKNQLLLLDETWTETVSLIFVRKWRSSHSGSKVAIRDSLNSLSSQCLFISSHLGVSPCRKLLLQHTIETSTAAILSGKRTSKRHQWYSLAESQE